jgi:hypothetical protein
MEEPKLEQFGLNRDLYNYLAKNRNRGHKFIRAVSVIIGWTALGIIGWQENFDESIVPRIVISAVISFFPGSVLALLIDTVLWHLYVATRNRFSKIYQKLNQYEVAHKNYVDWWNRTQESFWKSLSGKRFESELAILYSKLGYQVDFPKKGGSDKGIDFLLYQGSARIIVQCKRHNKPIGPHFARDLYGTLVSSHAHEAILASVSGFTPGVQDFVKGKRITLVSLEDIMRMTKEADANQQKKF